MILPDDKDPKVDYQIFFLYLLELEDYFFDYDVLCLAMLNHVISMLLDIVAMF